MNLYGPSGGEASVLAFSMSVMDLMVLTMDLVPIADEPLQALDTCSSVSASMSDVIVSLLV